MLDVLIIVEGQSDGAGQVVPAVWVKQAIATLQPAIQSAGHAVTVFSNQPNGNVPFPDQAQLILPLTLDLPAVPLLEAWLAPGHLYTVCRQVAVLRQRVAQELSYATGSGEYWLPIVQTAKGPLYGEVIGRNPDQPETYHQPLHLSDRWRQPLYRLGQGLLKLLQAPPATYLLQFGTQGQEVCFDRLYPFPAEPAIASLGVQSPDLFTCHWYCLSKQPLRDLWISGASPHQLLPQDS